MGYGDGKKKEIEEKILIRYFCILLQTFCIPLRNSVCSQNFCDGNYVWWMEKLYFIAFVDEHKVCWGKRNSFVRERKCNRLILIQSFSRKHSTLRQNTNVLWLNAKILGETIESKCFVSVTAKLLGEIAWERRSTEMLLFFLSPCPLCNFTDIYFAFSYVNTLHILCLLFRS